jgi:hypothetical protein
VTKLSLVADNTRSYEWESFPRREPRPARERLGPIRRSEKKKAPIFQSGPRLVVRASLEYSTSAGAAPAANPARTERTYPAQARCTSRCSAGFCGRDSAQGSGYHDHRSQACIRRHGAACEDDTQSQA